MKFRLFIFSLFFCLTASSQTSISSGTTNFPKSGLSDEELTFACDEYKKMIETNTYLESEKKTRAFAEKMQDFVISNNVPFDSIKDKSTALSLIKDNLEKTKFKSVAEAELCIDEMELSTEKLEKENKLLYELLDRANVEQRHKIFHPFFERVKSELSH